MTDQPQFRVSSTPDEANTESMGGCVMRLGWLMAAPIALLGLGASLARSGVGPWSFVSAAYWLVVVMAIAARYVDVVRYAGETSSGEPASRQDWRRFSLGMSGGALAGWLLALWVGTP